MHQYLDKHPQCNLGFQKEYHIFDAKYLETCRRIYHNRQASLAALRDDRNKAAGETISKLDKKIQRKSQLVSFYEDPATYAEYFASLYNQSPDTRLVGDITPAYSALEAAHYSEIRSLLESRGFTVKVVFLMRDPIERIYSAIYMEIARKKRRRQEIELGPEALFLKKYQSPKIEMKTRYEKTVKNLQDSFAAENIYFGFYETFFVGDGVRRVTDFLGLDFFKADTGKRVHAAQAKKSLSAASIKLAREYYFETYQFCFDKFGKEFISRIWKNANPPPPDKGMLAKIRKFTGV